MGNNLVSKLKPWVTTFSEAIRYQHHHKDELKVGGKITNIFNLAESSQDIKDMVYLTLDDGVGKISLVVPNDVYKELDKEYSFQKDMLVLADGKLLDPDGLLQAPTKLKKFEQIEPPPLPAIMCWNIEPYKEEAPSTVTE
jgi:hypothetical protein